MSLSFCQSMANQRIRCSLCEWVIEPGEICWHLSRDSNRDSFPVCRNHIPLNTRELIVEPSPDALPITSVRPQALNIRRDMIPKLLSDWDSVYNLTPEEFEELVFDRLLAMDLEPFRLGPANRRDGGIDIIFWTRSVFPILGAVQVKHHRSPEAKTGPRDGKGSRRRYARSSFQCWTDRHQYLIYR
jgi:hypothetical protein